MVGRGVVARWGKARCGGEGVGRCGEACIGMEWNRAPIAEAAELVVAAEAVTGGRVGGCMVERVERDCQFGVQVLNP